MVKGYVSALLECLGHADKGVREGASEALGVLMKIIGEPQLSKLMPDLDPIKMAKVKEYCEKTVLTGKFTNENIHHFFDMYFYSFMIKVICKVKNITNKSC